MRSINCHNSVIPDWKPKVPQARTRRNNCPTAIWHYAIFLPQLYLEEVALEAKVRGHPQEALIQSNESPKVWNPVRHNMMELVAAIVKAPSKDAMKGKGEVTTQK